MKRMRVNNAEVTIERRCERVEETRGKEEKEILESGRVATRSVSCSNIIRAA